VPNTAILNITEVFSSNSPSPGGPGSNLTISGNTPPGGGPTSMVTITGGFETTINGMNAVTFTTAFPGAITAINISMLNDNDNIVVGTPTGIINLPGTTLNVTEGSGNDTFTMGTAGSTTVSEVNNVLNAVNYKAANVNSTGMETVDILDAMVASINIQQNSGDADRIRLWVVNANGQVNLSQNSGASDTISIDQLVSTSPASLNPVNLFQNPGIETGDFTGWNASGVASVSSGSGVFHRIAASISLCWVLEQVAFHNLYKQRLVQAMCSATGSIRAQVTCRASLPPPRVLVSVSELAQLAAHSHWMTSV
jgi:hypothetical protein